MSDHKKLRDLAMMAAPGPWDWQDRLALIEIVARDGDVTRHVAGVTPEVIRHGAVEREQPRATAAFIATASPDVVIGLLDENERLRALVGRLVEVLDRIYSNSLWGNPEVEAVLADAAKELGR